MRLLIVTQKVNKNDAILGFFHRWIEEFAKHCEKVTVVCLEKGEYNLPENVSVHSLGKESNNASRVQYITRFYSLTWSKRKEYDVVFVHMNPEYIVLGGLLWRLLGKKISLWYLHKAVNLKLRIAELFTQHIFTATPESFRLKSKKVHVTGHGIDTEVFVPKEKSPSEVIRLLYIGRITPIKNLDKVIKAMSVLQKGGESVSLTVAGEPVSKSDESYYRSIKESAPETVDFRGRVSGSELVALYQSHDVVLNISETGSIDKVLLEALATGTKVLTSNPSLQGVLPESYRTITDPNNIAESIKELSQESFDPLLTEHVRREHSLQNLIKRILRLYA